MPAPRLTEETRAEFLGATNIAKVATHDEDGSIRIVPLWYRHIDDNKIELSTWMWTKTAQNIERDPKITILIDTDQQPYKGVHMKGTATLGDESTDPEVFGRWFGDYTGSEESGLEYAAQLIEMGGPRVPIIFTPERSYTWDYGAG
jgi:hypothetical protein